MCSLLDSVLHLIFDFLPLCRRVQRPDKDTLFDTVADAKLLYLAHQFGNERIVDLVKKVKTFDCQTGLATIEKSSNRGRAHSFVDVRIVANDHRVAASQFQSDPLDVLRRNFHYMFTRGRCSRETDFAYARILQQRFADDPARSGNNVEHARGQSGFMENLNDLNVRQWCRARWFDHDGVSGNEGRTDLIAQQRYRKIHRYNRTAT